MPQNTGSEFHLCERKQIGSFVFAFVFLVGEAAGIEHMKRTLSKVNKRSVCDHQVSLALIV